MSINKIYSNGSVEITVAASDKLIVKSLGGEVTVSQKVGYPNHPDSFDLLSTTADLASTTSSAFSAATVVQIEAGEGGAEYAVGTDAVFVSETMAAPLALNATGSVTAAMLLGGLITSTTGSAVTATVITGTVLDAAADFAIGDSIDVSVLATGGNAFTLTANTGITLVGSGVVATTTAVLFRIKKTAANVFVIYRIAG